MKLPGRSQLRDTGPAIGREVTPDTTRAGFVDDGSIAWPERIVEARRQWTQARPEDFEKVGKRRWRDRASGVEYREEDGCPLLSVGTDAARFVSCFLVVDGRLVFLKRADAAEGLVVHHGAVTSREIPNPGGQAPVVIH